LVVTYNSLIPGDPVHADSASTGARVLDDIWHREYRHLHAVASRMLRDRDDADDVVQEAFGRLMRVDLELDDPRAWLTVVVRRLCLNRLSTAYHRRESPIGSAPPEDRRGGPADPSAVDPADRVTLDDQVQHALAVVLERLSPPERTAFVLHDIFGLPYEQIGQVVGRSATACRQLASRARRSVRSSPPSPTGPVRARATDEHRRLVERFVAACAGGDVAGLVGALDPGAAVDTVMLDGTQVGHGEGAERVASDAVRFLGPGSGTVLVTVLGDHGVDAVALYSNGGHGVFDIDVVDGAIHHLRITVVAPPEPRPAGPPVR
jgi:RNA polymerase sigma-70 factor, ECF subfamily